MAGPLLPLDVRAGTHQALSDWGMRAAFFIGIGQVVALLVHQPRAHSLSALRVAVMRAEVEMNASTRVVAMRVNRDDRAAKSVIDLAA